MTDNLENQPHNEVRETHNTFNLAREIWEWFYTIALAVIVVLVIKGFIFDIVRVDGPSMLPTLVNNDRLIITKLGYEPKAGDIIILDSTYKNRQEYFEEYEAENGKELNAISKSLLYFKLPSELKQRYYVKRVIAMPGDTIDIQDGNVYLNGEELYEPYYKGLTTPTDYSVDYPITVEEGHIFVMGDNRPNSLDSRSSSLGQVPIDAVIGKSQLRIWPFSAAGQTK